MRVAGMMFPLLLLSTAIAPQHAWAQRAGVQGWKPSPGQVARLEARLASRRLQAARLRDRVRIYSGIVERGKRYLVGVLITPSWHGKPYNPSQRDPGLPASWNVGRYIVPVSRFPSRMSFVPERGCEWIRVRFDLAGTLLSETGCIE